MFDVQTSVLDPEYGEELDEERLEEYINALMAEFEQSPEAEAFSEEFDTSLGWSATYMQYAAQYFGATPATITPAETFEILFETFPRKVSVESDKGGEIVAELRAFWQYLKRTRSIENADAILDLLTDEGANRLEAALADSSHFGMAKSFVMSGQEAGFDMTDPDDMQRFMLAYNVAQLEKFASEKPKASPSPPPQRPATIHRPSQRVGRNEPCPCGSGRKFKKCCMR